MSVSPKVERELLREEYINAVSEFFYGRGDEVLSVKSNEIAMPVVGCNDGEYFVVITVKVPTGANKGLEPYDGYELATDYEMKIAEKERKKIEAEKKKAEKIRKDEAIRQKKKEIAEKGE